MLIAVTNNFQLRLCIFCWHQCMEKRLLNSLEDPSFDLRQKRKETCSRCPMSNLQLVLAQKNLMTSFEAAKSESGKFRRQKKSCFSKTQHVQTISNGRSIEKIFLLIQKNRIETIDRKLEKEMFCFMHQVKILLLAFVRMLKVYKFLKEFFSGKWVLKS